MIGEIFNFGSKIIDKLFPDKAEAEKIKLKLIELQNSGELARLAHESEIVKEQSANIRAEATSDSFLARTWRPIVMLVFTALVVARFFGFTAPGITEKEYLELFSIIKISIGGYVVGRSAEKIADKVKSVIK